MRCPNNLAMERNNRDAGSRAFDERNTRSGITPEFYWLTWANIFRTRKELGRGKKNAGINR